MASEHNCEPDWDVVTVNGRPIIEVWAEQATWGKWHTRLAKWLGYYQDEAI